MEKLTPEMHRILLKRLTKALHKAKYEPALVAGDDGPAEMAAAVLFPFLTPEHADVLP